jgi:VIT1/CCC1 family predicted Fe2+/Mn2+ transporter
VTSRPPHQRYPGVFENSQVELPGKVERKNKLSFVVSDEELEMINTARGNKAE